MATAKQLAAAKAAKAAQAKTRTPLKAAPEPGDDPRKETTGDEPDAEEGEDETASETTGLDRQAEDEAKRTVDTLDVTGKAAAAPSPTQEQLYTANDAPGAGGTDAAVAAAPRRRTRLKDETLVKVKVPRAFNITRDDGEMVHYPANTEEMPKDDAEHWYAEANGVELL